MQRLIQTFVSKACRVIATAPILEALAPAPSCRGAVLPALSYDFDEGMSAGAQARGRRARGPGALGRRGVAGLPSGVAARRRERIP